MQPIHPPLRKVLTWVVCLLSGCLAFHSPALTMTTPIPFQVLDLGPTPLERQFVPRPQVLVFTDSRSWQRFWQRSRVFDLNLQRPAAPPINFRRQAVVGFTIGSRPTGGYGLRIDRLESVTDNQGTYWRLHYTESVPGPNCLVTQALTTPTVFIAVPPPVPQIQLQGRTVVVPCQ